MNPNKMVFYQISLNPSSIARILGIIAIILVFASVGGQLTRFITGHGYVHGLVPLFNVDGECNIPTYFSSILLLISALLLFIITSIEIKLKTSHALYWGILSCGFLLMAIDEALFLHERLINPMRHILGYGNYGEGASNLGVFNFAWVIPAIVLILILAFYFRRFFLRLPKKSRLTFLIAALLYIGGAIGFELIGGYYCELHGETNLTYSMITTVEESLEMTGSIVFIYGLLLHIAENYNVVQFRFDSLHSQSPSKVNNDLQ